MVRLKVSFGNMVVLSIIFSLSTRRTESDLNTQFNILSKKEHVRKYLCENITL